jgi:hypothetical protein
VAEVAKIQWEQKIMEKESEKKIAEIEGMHWSSVSQMFDDFLFSKIWLILLEKKLMPMLNSTKLSSKLKPTV